MYYIKKKPKEKKPRKESVSTLVKKLDKVMDEVWKDIRLFDKYQVSSIGRVRNKKTGKIRKILLSNKGYPFVSLYIRIQDGKEIRRNYLIHRLVADAFIPNPDNKPEVDHINTIVTDNRIENLRWVTKKENSNNPLTLKHIGDSKRGEKSPYWGKPRTEVTKMKMRHEHKKSDKYKHGANHRHSKHVYQYDLDGNYITEYDCMRDASRATGINYGMIAYCCDGRYKRGGQFLWSYEYKDRLPPYDGNRKIGVLIKRYEQNVLFKKYKKKND